jgi:hypothetical protein
MGLLLQLTQKLAHGFLGFYNRYPRKEARKDAEKAWGQAKVTPEIEDAIHKALDWQIPLYEQREKHFIPLPASYLRGERWTDEPPTPPKSPMRSLAIVKGSTPEQTQQQDVTARIQCLISRGMDREDAKQQVYRELGWIKEPP